MTFRLDGLDKPAAETRVMVAMSGGVDSSATAALLVDAGYDVIGVTLRLYDHGVAVGRSGTCCAGQDIHDARRVADALGIAHYVLDVEARFRDAVIDPFAQSYARGETPVPCVLCNQTVKFGDLIGRARFLGADVLATGHYARWRPGPQLWRGADPVRDQSYFLFATTRDQLGFLRFPLGGLDKAATRAVAARFGLPVSAKPASQDICFVPDGDYAALVARLRPEAAVPGDIVDRDGRVLGRHDGVVRYTVGQRRGLGIAGPEPLYVLRLEPERGRVVVGPRAALVRRSLTVRGLNWLGGGDLAEARVTVKLRSTMAPEPAVVRALDDRRAAVRMERDQIGIAAGQACVFYRGERMLGGGWIEAEAAEAESNGRGPGDRSVSAVNEP